MKSDFFNKNLDVLQAYNPELAERLLKQEIGFYELASGSDGLWNLCYRERRPPVYFYDPLDPAGQVNKYLTKMSDRKNRFLVILGFGLGYPTLQLINRNLKLLKVIIVERDLACLKIAMQCRDLTDLFRHQAVRIIAGCDKNALFVTLYQAIHPYYAGLKEMRFLPWPASILIDKAYYHQVAQTFRQIVDRHFADRGNDPYDTLVAYEHFFANLPELLRHPGARQVKNLFVGQPAIVIATGPSLKKNIHLLNKLDDRAVLLSADASLRILHQDNIRPHLVTTVERGPGYDVYYKGLENLEQTVFAAAAFIHPSTLKAYNGPRVFFHRLYHFMKYLGFNEDAIPLGLSTAHMAYEVARHMGCNPIILVGHDLAYDAFGHTHAPGFILGEKQALYQNYDPLFVPGNSEPWVKTCDGWFAGIKEYEKRITDWDGMLINATEGGAKIQGSTVMTLQEVIDQYCRYPFKPRETLMDCLASWNNPHRIATMTKTLDRFLEADKEFISICLALRPILSEIVQKIERAGNPVPPDLMNQVDRTVPHVETVLNNFFDTPLFHFFNEYFYSDALPLLMEWQVLDERFSNSNWANAYRIKLAENFFGGIGQLCLSLQTVLKHGREDLKTLSGD